MKSIQEEMLASAQDHGAAPSVLATLGRFGKHAQNIEREFHHRFAALIGIGLEPYPFEAPVNAHGVTEVRTLHMILPHELFAHLFHWDKALFDDVFFGFPGETTAFWTNVERWAPDWLCLQMTTSPQDP